MLLQVILLDMMKWITSLNDAWQTCGVSMDQSNRPNGDLNMHVHFNMAKRTFRI